jgi:GntR family transcriptional regulator
VDIIIRNTGDQPIYQQIYDQIRAQILTGDLSVAEPLPSIRQLATGLRISVITTKRAYDNLERDGFIITVPGKGSFVAEKNLELVREVHLKEIESLLSTILTKARLSNISHEELIELLNLLEKENKYG